MSDAALCFEVFTLFPDAIAGFLRGGLIGKAIEHGLVDVRCTDYRDYTADRHRTVDDTPYGGGPGMVIQPGPVVAALEAVTAARGPMHRVLLTPSAPRFDQSAARRLAAMPRIGLLCGRYEGIDDRVREAHVDECLSLGDFVLNGGEIAALAIVESVARLREGVLGNPASAALDSFSEGETPGSWLEAPQYTRPPNFRGRTVPAVLLAGNHADVARWRAEQAWARTWSLRPDLRPRHRLPDDTPLYLLTDDLRLAPLAVPIPAGEPLRDLKSLRRHLRRRHGRDPQLIGLATTTATDLPVAHDAAALLDLLALRGDLSSPLVFVPPAVPASGGDLTKTPESREAGSPWPATVSAVLSLAPAAVSEAAFQLARTPPMSDSSPPAASHALAVAALSQLRPYAKP